MTISGMRFVSLKKNIVNFAFNFYDERPINTSAVSILLRKYIPFFSFVGVYVYDSIGLL